jgi:hypothetical protein
MAAAGLSSQLRLHADMRIIDKEHPVTVDELAEMAARMFGDLVKAVVDVERGIMAVDAVMHADEEEELLEAGSQQTDLWGINLHIKRFATEDFVEFDSMINIRPVQENMSRGVESAQLREEIVRIVGGLVRT